MSPRASARARTSSVSRGGRRRSGEAFIVDDVYLAGQMLLLFARGPVIVFWHLLLAGMIVTKAWQVISGKVITSIMSTQRESPLDLLYPGGGPGAYTARK